MLQYSLIIIMADDDDEMCICDVLNDDDVFLVGILVTDPQLGYISVVDDTPDSDQPSTYGNDPRLCQYRVIRSVTLPKTRAIRPLLLEELGKMTSLQQRFYESTANSQPSSMARSDALDIFQSAVQAALPKTAIEKAMKYVPETDALHVQNKVFDMKDYDSIRIIGFGKAAAEMVSTVRNIVLPLKTKDIYGHLVTKHDHVKDSDYLRRKLTYLLLLSRRHHTQCHVKMALGVQKL